MAAQPNVEPTVDESSVHRLRDILVEEVSLVDRAANKRRFLIVKRKNEMVNASDKDDETETEEARRRKAKKPRPDDETDAEKARRPRSEEGECEGDAPANKAGRRKPTEVDEEPEGRKRAARGGGAAPSDVEEDDEDEAAEQSAVGEALDRGPSKGRSSKTKASKDDEDEDEEDAAKRERRRREVAEPAGAEPPAKSRHAEAMKTLTAGLERLLKLATRVQESGDGLPDDIATEAAAVASTLSALAPAPASATGVAAATAPVAKAGARMAKERLERFNKAIELLSSILKELTEARDSPPGPSAGNAQAGVQKRAPSAPELRAVVANIGELTEVIKQQGEELARLRKAAGVSNAIPVEGSRRRPAEDVSWPLDMNRPIGRDQVDKSVSFYDSNEAT